MKRSDRLSLLREMSATQAALNSLLQQLGGAAHKSIFGSAERQLYRRRRLARLAGCVEALR